MRTGIKRQEKGYQLEGREEWEMGNRAKGGVNQGGRRNKLGFHPP